MANSKHEPKYTETHADGQFSCRVRCSCKKFEATGRSTGGARRAFGAAQQQWNKHVAGAESTVTAGSATNLQLAKKFGPPAIAVGVAAAAVALIVSLTSHDSTPSVDADADYGAAPYSATATDSPEIEPYDASTEETDEVEPQAPADDGVASELAERGLDASDVQRVGAMADLTGYGLGEGTSLSYEQAENFAYVLIDTCDSVAAGETTWQDQIEQDVIDGAPPGEATTMNNYLRDQFCPEVS